MTFNIFDMKDDEIFLTRCAIAISFQSLHIFIKIINKLLRAFLSHRTTHNLYNNYFFRRILYKYVSYNVSIFFNCQFAFDRDNACCASIGQLVASIHFSLFFFLIEMEMHSIKRCMHSNVWMLLVYVYFFIIARRYFSIIL